MERKFIFCALLLGITVVFVSAKQGFGPGDQDWGFVNVRKGAHMFYWLYYTTANVSDYTKRPLAIWLQGGPGASSTGYGNFEELGPIDIYGKPRNHTWVKDMNVLFIDNPVGSGFSYVDNLLYLTSNNKQIAYDLVELMKAFYKLHPEFETVPLHIFCESYGGKMAPEFALELYKAVKRGEVRSNLTSVALGDPWTSPIDSVLTWAPLLLNMGIVDKPGYNNIMVEAIKTEALVKSQKWQAATVQWSKTQSVLLYESKGVDFYNIEKPTLASAFLRKLVQSQSSLDLMYRTMVNYDLEENRSEILRNLMIENVTKSLEIPVGVKWGSQSGATFSRLSGDFMKPVVDIVTDLLDNTDLKVIVYSGHLDLICATAGTVNWIDKMKWSYKNEYVSAPRVGISVNRILEGYEKGTRNFTMIWVNRAGHMVPADSPAGMDYILRKITNYDK